MPKSIKARDEMEMEIRNKGNENTVELQNPRNKGDGGQSKLGIIRCWQQNRPCSKEIGHYNTLTKRVEIKTKRRMKIEGMKVKLNEIGHCIRLMKNEIKAERDQAWQDINDGD